MSRRRRGGALAVAGTVLAGAATLLTGLLDPSFLVGAKGLWFPIVSTASRFVGPVLLPRIPVLGVPVPWEGLTLAAATTFVAVSLYSLGKRSDRW